MRRYDVPVVLETENEDPVDYLRIPLRGRVTITTRWQKQGQDLYV